MIARSKSLEQCRLPAKAYLLLGIDLPDGGCAVPMRPRVAAEYDWSEEDEGEDVEADDRKCEEQQILRKQAARQRSMELLTGSRRESTSALDVDIEKPSEQHDGVDALESLWAYEGEISIRWCEWRMCRVRGSSGSTGARAWPAQHLSAVVAAWRP
jgi:hypothetical protein